MSSALTEHRTTINGREVSRVTSGLVPHSSVRVLKYKTGFTSRATLHHIRFPPTHELKQGHENSCAAHQTDGDEMCWISSLRQDGAQLPAAAARRCCWRGWGQSSPVRAGLNVIRELRQDSGTKQTEDLLLRNANGEDGGSRKALSGSAAPSSHRV